MSDHVQVSVDDVGKYIVTFFKDGKPTSSFCSANGKEISSWACQQLKDKDDARLRKAELDAQCENPVYPELPMQDAPDMRQEPLKPGQWSGD